MTSNHAFSVALRLVAGKKCSPGANKCFSSSGKMSGLLTPAKRYWDTKAIPSGISWHQTSYSWCFISSENLCVSLVWPDEPIIFGDWTQQKQETQETDAHIQTVFHRLEHESKKCEGGKKNYIKKLLVSDSSFWPGRNSL